VSIGHVLGKKAGLGRGMMVQLALIGNSAGPLARSARLA